jgi:hypothetical protein
MNGDEAAGNGHRSNGNGTGGEHFSTDDQRTRLQRVLSLILGIKIGGAPATQDDRPTGWYVEVDDWPIGKTEDDLPPSEALKALKGLSRDYYEPAMRSLARTPPAEPPG